MGKVVRLSMVTVFVAILVLVPAHAGARSWPSGVSGCTGPAGSLLTRNPWTGNVDALVAPASDSLGIYPIPGDDYTPLGAAERFLALCGWEFGVEYSRPETAGISSSGLTLEHTNEIAGLNSHVIERFQVTKRGVPIFGSQLIIDLDGELGVKSVHASNIVEVQVTSATTIAAGAAQVIAIDLVADHEQLDPSALQASPAELWIYNPISLGLGRSRDRLVWRTNIRPGSTAPINYLVLVDANDGSIALSLNQVDTFALPRYTYNMYNGQTTGYLVCYHNESHSDPNCTWGEYDSKYAHINAGTALNLYANILGRNSINGSGMQVNSFVHYAWNYCNAFWDGEELVYGDGCSLITDDVVGHEFTHGVTDYTSGLVYANQAGAINESMSDVFGEWIDQNNGRGLDGLGYNWKIGEETSIGSIRDMRDPTVFRDPDKLSSKLFKRFPATAACNNKNDNCGVHTNSGVGNKAAYLIVEGGSFNGHTISGIGWGKAIRIYYQTQLLLPNSSDYRQLASALVSACSGMVGSYGISTADCAQVREATYATEMITAYTISGSTGTGKVGLSWLVNGRQMSTKSAEDGFYQISVPVNWTGTIAPTMKHYTFSFREYSTPIEADLANQDFTPVPENLYLAGKTGVAGAKLVWTGSTSGTTNTDGYGNYSLPIPYGWTGTVTISKGGCIFKPDHSIFSKKITKNTKLDFKASCAP